MSSPATDLVANAGPEVTPAPPRRRGLRIPAGGSLWVMIALYLGLMAAAAAPSPIYVLYQAQWHFSEMTVTVIYGAYALALLVTLLTVGGLSDFIGRKPVLLAGFGALALSMVVFALADGVAWLYAARILQGSSTPPGRNGSGSRRSRTGWSHHSAWLWAP
jgi:MFS family permease